MRFDDIFDIIAIIVFGLMGVGIIAFGILATILLLRCF